jgi:FkbM family methyltransferase
MRAAIDFQRFTPAAHPLARRMRLLEEHKVDVILDVGANVGQYAVQMRDLGYVGWLVSYEPLAAAYAELAQHAATDDKWRVVHAGLGPEAGPAMINIAGNSQSSSLLPMLELHAQVAPESTFVGTETITLQTLATALAECDAPGARPFVKIDAQGYERPILESGGPALERVVGLQLELSLTPLYEGEATMTEMLVYLEKLGFVPMSLEPGYADPKTGRLLQVDGIFFRK